MANICSNYISFTKDGSFPTALRDELVRLEAEGQGLLFNQDALGYVSDFSFEENHGNSFNFSVNFSTRWSPNIEVFAALCAFFNVEGTLEYEEFGSGVFGAARYDPITGTCSTRDLPDASLNLIEEDDEDSTCTVGSLRFNCRTEAAEYLLDLQPFVTVDSLPSFEHFRSEFAKGYNSLCATLKP